MTNLDGDSIRYPLFSPKHRVEKNGLFAVALAHVLAGADSKFRVGDALKTTTELLSKGITQDGAEPAPCGLSRWGGRFMCEELPKEPMGEDMYFAWVSRDFWDYEPNLVFFTKAEFVELLVDCLGNYVASHPERKEEFAEALLANGVTL